MVVGFRKHVTLGLLLYALLDLTVPGLCHEVGAVQAPSAASIGSNPAPGDAFPSIPGAEDDDCFCCCSHIRPALPQSVGIDFPAVTLSVALASLVPSLNRTPTHQPPRR